MDFNEINRLLVRVLLRIPELQRFNNRTALIEGLPPVSLNRDESSAQADLRNMISGLEKLGRLTKEGGVRPVIVVVNNALATVSEGGEISDDLHDIKRQLEDYYGGETQPEPEPVPAETYEALIFGQQRDTRLPYEFIEKAKSAARSVARLTVSRIFNGVPDGKAMYGTGWLIAPGILMTNHHVIDARDRRKPPWGPGEDYATPTDFEAQAKGVVVWFDFHIEAKEAPHLECKGAELLAQNKGLDYAVIKLNDVEKIADRKPLSVIPVQPSLVRGSRMNILQHPKGGPLRYAIRNNFFVSPGKKPSFLWYQTDTEPGASGSPVCNDDWQVVALHHASVTVDPQQVPQEIIGGQPVTVKVLNEAIKAHEILNDLPLDLKQLINIPQVD